MDILMITKEQEQNVNKIKKIFKSLSILTMFSICTHTSSWTPILWSI